MNVRNILIGWDVYIHVGNRHVFIHDYNKSDMRTFEDEKDNYGLLCHYDFFDRGISGQARRTENPDFEIYRDCNKDVEAFPWPTSLKIFFKRCDHAHLTFDDDEGDNKIKLGDNAGNLIVIRESTNERYEITPDGKITKTKYK